MCGEVKFLQDFVKQTVTRNLSEIPLIDQQQVERVAIRIASPLNETFSLTGAASSLK